ncbi:asparagine synthase [Pokkaliibacter plantistimulans]|uniref:asparagine synthase (glutamine-hydrolyzing) n=1 Tax=Pokkaliibacter plantistimulans TaxID=1635171 RepID=A0ABX5M693_9GAMM|nr:asparagine synthase (glutamine-hydrolyzing) [Pokkaliibacter plantistimulans]PXF33118.1 asparagine synthase [Pokkaliibacter plantistimulans]
MCGIAGFFNLASGQGEDIVEPMLRSLAQRGPDAQHWCGWNQQGERVKQGVSHGMLHARLSIRDPRPEADQPMTCSDEDVWLCYNGEVYGWEDDADILRENGAVFRTRSDSEFILHGYRYWGIEGLLPRLRGMFAIVLLDWRTRKVWLIRDRLGLKPLLYHHSEQGLGYASLLRALIPMVPAAARQFSAAAIDAYLTHRYVPAPHTILDGVNRLENGHYLCYDLDTGSLEKNCYWRPEAKNSDYRQCLDDSIRLRTVADRPVGMLLSGGVDSTVLAARLNALGFSNLKAFTASFPGDSLDEGDDACSTAEQLGMPFHREVMPNSIKADFERIVADMDEPFADPSCIPLWYLARRTTDEVKVVLNGDGGDELFGGYKRYQQHLKRHFRVGIRLPWRKSPASLKRKGLLKVINEWQLSWQEAYSLRFSGFTPAQRRALQPSLPHFPAHYWRAPDWQADDPLQQLLAIDMANYLPEYILRKADLTTMAHGLEGRSPLLDHIFVQQVMGLPASQRFTQPVKQALAYACETLQGLSPFHRKKRGFNPPLQHWLLNDLAQYYDGLGRRLQVITRGQLNEVAIESLVARYRRGDAAYAEQVLQLLILDISLQQLSRIIQ